MFTKPTYTAVLGDHANCWSCNGTNRVRAEWYRFAEGDGSANYKVCLCHYCCPNRDNEAEVEAFFDRLRALNLN